MLKFIAPSNYKGNPGQILTCKGNIFVTKVENKQVVLCSNITTSIQEIAYRAALPIGFLPIGAQNNMYSSASTNTDRTKTWMYATEPESIGGLIYNGQIVSTSKTEPLVLYYLFDGNQLSLSLYNLQARVTTPIISLATNTTLGIEKCQFIIGGFTSSKQQDIFASCGVFNVTNAFFNQADQYIASDAGLGNWCSSNSVSNNLNSIIMVGDFNGDLLSDLFCTATRHAMINKLGSFREILLVKQMPGNWATQFSNQYNQQNIAIGDLDGNGLSDFVSLTSSANPEILFNNKLNNFINYPGNKNSDGSFTINSVNKWCGSNSNAELVIIDADNDGKDDLLCKNNDLTSSQYGQVYLSLSRTDPYVAPSNQTLQKVIVILEDFVIGDNIGYFISDKNAPLFCDASRLFEYHTKVRCALNSPNKVEGFTNPVRLSNSIPSTEVRSHVKGSIYLGDADRYGELNLESKEVYNEIPRSRFQFPKAKTWGLESKNFIDPSRSFDSKITTQFIRQGRVKDKKYHAIDQVYGHSVHGGDCNEVNFNFITLTNYFTASGRIEAYDQNNNKILDANLLNDLANIYVLAGNTTTPLGTNTTITINKIAGGAVSFSFNGEIELQTLYQKNVTHCSIKGITQNDITDNQVVPAGSAASTSSDDQSALCAFEMDPEQQYTNTTISGSTRSPSLLTRADILELGGIIYAGAAFFPDVIKNATKAGNLGIDRYSTNIDDITSKLNYNNSISLNAYLRNGGEYFAQAPHNELMIDFRQNGKVIYEPTRIRFANGTMSSTAAALYAGFDNIKQIKLAAFDATHILLAWTIYIAEEKQYYLLIDYANTGGNILRIPLYDKDFNIVIANQRFGNEFYVSYRSSPDKLVISRYSAESFALSRSVEVGIDDASENDDGNSEFILQVEEVPASEAASAANSASSGTSTEATSNLVLIRNHNDNKGLFIKKFDIFLNEIGSETNIICDNSKTVQMQSQIQSLDSVPTKADDGYDVLRLNYQHNSRTVYHSNDTTYNLNKKIALQNGLNLLYRGLDYLKAITKNTDSVIQNQIQTSLEGLVCDPVLAYQYLGTALDKTHKLLKSDLTFEIHTSTSNPNCKASSYYPAYRVGTVVHLCENFDFIVNADECSRFVSLAQTTKNLMLPTTTVDSNVLTNLLAYFPSDVVAGYTQIINSAALANNGAGICDTGSAYVPPVNQQTHQQSNDYANNIVNNLVAGLISADLPKARVKLTTDYNGCLGMVQRGCAASYEKASNILCVSYFFEAAATASVIVEAASSDIEAKYNCVTGCDLDNPALAKLTSALGGYVTSEVKDSFIPKDYTYVLAQLGSVPTQDNPDGSNATFASTNTKILTAIPTYFYERNASLIAFAYLGNDYIDLKAQYYQLNSATTLGSEQFLGRFLNVRQIQTVAFNQSSVLIGYSVKHPTQNIYNILIQYTTPTITKILNVYPSYNGVFALDTVPTATTSTNTATNADASTEFMVSYPSSATEITSKRYKIEKTSITEQLRVTDTVAAIPDAVLNNPNITAPLLFVNAFTDNTFNVIWSYLDQAGIKVQRHGQQSGNSIGNAETITGSDNAETFAQTLKVGAGDAGKTIVTWQNLDQVYLSMINQTPTQAQTQTSQQGQEQVPYTTLNFAANNFTLQDAKMVDEIKDIVSLTLKDLSNNLKTILVDAGSSELSFVDILDITAGQLSLGTNTTSNITSGGNSGGTSNANYLFSELLGTITKSLNINSNAQQCPNTDGYANADSANGNSDGNTASSNINNLLNNLNIQDILSQAGDILQDKTTLVDQIQAALNIPQVKASLDQLGIKEDVIYSMIDKLSSIVDLQDYIKNSLNKFKDFDISQIPDTDITTQIQAGQDFTNAIANAFANTTSSTQGRKLNAEDVTDILSILSKIPLPTDLSEDGIIEYLHDVFKDIMIWLIRTFLQPIFDELQGLTQERHFEVQSTSDACIAGSVMLIVGIAIIGFVAYAIEAQALCKKLTRESYADSTIDETERDKQCATNMAKLGSTRGLILGLITIGATSAIAGSVGELACIICLIANAVKPGSACGESTPPAPPPPISNLLNHQGVCATSSQKREFAALAQASCTPCDTCNKQKLKRNIKIRGAVAMAVQESLAVEVSVIVENPQNLQVAVYDDISNLVDLSIVSLEGKLIDFDVAIAIGVMCISYSLLNSPDGYSVYTKCQIGDIFIPIENAPLQATSSSVKLTSFQGKAYLTIEQKDPGGKSDYLNSFELDPQVQKITRSNCFNVQPSSIRTWDMIANGNTILVAVLTVDSTLEEYAFKNQGSCNTIKTSTSGVSFNDATSISINYLNDENNIAVAVAGASYAQYFYKRKLLDHTFICNAAIVEAGNVMSAAIINGFLSIFYITNNLPQLMEVFVISLNSAVEFVVLQHQLSFMVQDVGNITNLAAANAGGVFDVMPGNAYTFPSGSNIRSDPTPAPPQSPGGNTGGDTEEQSTDEMKKTSSKINDGILEKIEPMMIIVNSISQYFWIGVSSTTITWKANYQNIDILTEPYIVHHKITKQSNTIYGVVSKFDTSKNQYQVVAKLYSGLVYNDYNTITAPRRFEGMFAATSDTFHLYIAVPNEQNTLDIYIDKKSKLSNNEKISVYPEDIIIMQAWSPYNVVAQAKRYIEKISISCYDKATYAKNDNNYQIDANWFSTVKIDTFTSVGVVAWQVYAKDSANGLGSTQIQCYNTECKQIGTTIKLSSQSRFHDIKLLSDDAVVLVESTDATYTIKVYANMALRLLDVGSPQATTATTDLIFPTNTIRDMTISVKQPLTAPAGQSSTSGTPTAVTKTAVVYVMYAMNTDVFVDTVTIKLSSGGNNQDSIGISCQNPLSPPPPQAAGENAEFLMNDEYIN